MIDIGVVKPIDENILKEKILEDNKKQELREYAQYEVLKKKFENYNPKEKYGVLSSGSSTGRSSSSYKGVLKDSEHILQ